ncbi:MAG: peptidoglycan bridge formation glycyltransferase FemA/FemB family protein [Candidatus Woykebacteria bacterium]
MFQIKEITDKNTWEVFNLASSEPSFLQSWAWGQFQKALGLNIFRLGIFDGEDLVGISQIYEERAKLGSFFYCSAGPVFKGLDKKKVQTWLEYVGDLVKKHGGVFLRVDPRKVSETEKNLFVEAGFTEAPEFTQPQCSAIIDLTKSEEELRHNMSSSTRYNVNSAQRKGVRVREGKKSEVGVFLKLLKETADRKTLVLSAQENYHKKQYETLAAEGLMKLYIAEGNGQPLSAALVVNYADTAYYLHAANSLEKKNLRASYPLVWHTILQAKRAGLKKFDFWGAAPTEDPKHPWSGVTSFKLSFGATKECYESPFDLPYSSKYQLMKVVEIWRRPVRKILRFGSK